MKNEKHLRRYLDRRAPTSKRLFVLLAPGVDVPVEVLYAAIAADGDKRHFRYKQQHVGHYMWLFNTRYFPLFKMNVVARPGVKPHTYRLYRKGE